MIHKTQRKPDLQNRSLLVARQNFLAFQLLHLATLLCFSDGVSATVLFASGVANIAIYGYLITKELRYALIQIDVFLVYLVAGMLRLGFGTCWAAATYASGHLEALKFGPVHVEQFLMSGQACMIAGDWGIILGWTIWQARRRSKTIQAVSASITNQGTFNRAIGLLLFGWLVKALVTAGVPLHSLGNFASLFINYASPAGLYLLYVSVCSMRENSLQQYHLLLGGILAIELMFSLSSYMKSATLILLISIGLCSVYTMFNRRLCGLAFISKKQVSFGAIIAVFVLLILFPFSQIRRSSYRPNRGSVYGVSISTALTDAATSSIPGTTAFGETHKFPSNGMWTFFHRQSDIVSASWVCKYVNRNGHTSGEFITDSFINFIPRIAWADKPFYWPGRKITVLTGFAKSAESATTSTAVGGIAPSVFLNIGPWVIIPACTLVGIILAIFSERIMPTIHSNPIGTTIYLSLIIAAAMHFEDVMDCGVNICVYWLVVYLLMLYFSNRIFDNMHTHQLRADARFKQ